MPFARTYNNNIWAAAPKPPEAPPAPVVPVPPVPGTPPAPTPPNPFGQESWWKTRGGHELYNIFTKIEQENPMAAWAFWDAVVGTGRGMNDLQAATIHKKFGGDINAFKNWRNTYHNNSMESYQGNFDLATGKWTPSQGFNPQYVKDRLGWDLPASGWQANWNWKDYENTLKTGLQSLPGHEQDGAEAWNTYLWGARFGPNGVEYPSVYEQAVGSGLIKPINPATPTRPVGTTPGAPRTTPNPYTLNQQRGQPPAPAVVAPTPTPTPNPETTPPTPVNPYPTTPVNPQGARGTYRYTPSRR